MSFWAAVTTTSTDSQSTSIADAHLRTDTDSPSHIRAISQMSLPHSMIDAGASTNTVSISPSGCAISHRLRIGIFSPLRQSSHMALATTDPTFGPQHVRWHHSFSWCCYRCHRPTSRPRSNFDCNPSTSIASATTSPSLFGVPASWRADRFAALRPAIRFCHATSTLVRTERPCSSVGPHFDTATSRR